MSLKMVQSHFPTSCNGSHHPTGGICSNDVLTSGVLRRVQVRGISVPEAVSIPGFDDIEIARILLNELTTIWAPHQRMGTKAAKSLIKMVVGNLAETTTELKVSLEVRGSLYFPNEKSRLIVSIFIF